MLRSWFFFFFGQEPEIKKVIKGCKTDENGIQNLMVSKNDVTAVNLFLIGILSFNSLAMNFFCGNKGSCKVVIAWSGG